MTLKFRLCVCVCVFVSPGQLKTELILIQKVVGPLALWAKHDLTRRQCRTVTQVWLGRSCMKLQCFGKKLQTLVTRQFFGLHSARTLFCHKWQCPRLRTNEQTRFLNTNRCGFTLTKEMSCAELFEQIKFCWQLVFYFGSKKVIHTEAPRWLPEDYFTLFGHSDLVRTLGTKINSLCSRSLYIIFIYIYNGTRFVNKPHSRGCFGRWDHPNSTCERFSKTELLLSAKTSKWRWRWQPLIWGGQFTKI